MEDLNKPVDLDRIISLYETESNRKRESAVVSIFSAITDKIKAVLAPKPSEPEISYEPEIVHEEKLPEKIEFRSEEILEDDEFDNGPKELNLESLQEFFNRHHSEEQDELFNRLMSEQHIEQENMPFIDSPSLDSLLEIDSVPSFEQAQHPQPEFSSCSYHQRIQQHAKQESKNEQLWRRRQAILNGDGS